MKPAEPSTPSGTFEELLNLMGLRQDAIPSIEVDQKSAPRRVIRNLLGRDAIPTYQAAPDDLKWLVEGEEPCRDNIESVGILDLLGEYDSGKRRVVLYDLLIRLCAVKMCIDYNMLYEIVVCHELSHAATHLGVDEAGIWDCFAMASSETTEYFAQIYSHLYFASKGYSSVTEAMQKLASAQPLVYQKYLADVSKSVADINEDLLHARRQIPPGMELLPDVLSKPWHMMFTNLRKYRNPHYVEPQYRGFPHIDVIYWDNEKYPWDKQWLTSGTEVKIAGTTIKIRSYDYSPTSDQLSLHAAHDLYKLLLERWQVLGKHVIESSEEDYLQFSVAVGSDSMSLNTRNSEVIDLWKDMCGILGRDYPVLKKVLLKYEDELRARNEDA